MIYYDFLIRSDIYLRVSVLRMVFVLKRLCFDAIDDINRSLAHDINASPGDLTFRPGDIIGDLSSTQDPT